MDRCCACSREFANGDRVVTFYFERVLRGEKSGELGYYEDFQYTEEAVDRVHFLHTCLEKCFSPVENPFYYDFLADQVRKEIYEDEQDRDEYDQVACMEDEDPPYCLWCKKEDTVWLQQQRDMWIFFCTACNKLWDQDEDELVFDPQRGYLLAE